MNMSMQEQARLSRKAAASLVLHQVRVAILLRLSTLLESNVKEILKRNLKDIEEADVTGMAESSRARLLLSEKKIRVLSDGIRMIAAQRDPMFNALSATELAKDLVLRKVSVPIGVLLVIFESR
jgi:delta-1-pyrroline-5-carboxylate synthetase